MTKRKQIKELIEKLKIAENNIKIQKDIINKQRETNNQLSIQYNKDLLALSKRFEKIQQFEAPVKFIQYPERKTSYLIFADGHFVKVKLCKGDKNNSEIALMYLLVKNSYDMEKLKELRNNRKLLKKGEKLPIEINTKK